MHDARVRLRDAGRETIVNVLDAESELFNSEINLVTSIYDEKLAVYRLAVAMGRDIRKIIRIKGNAQRRNGCTLRTDFDCNRLMVFGAGRSACATHR